MEIAALEIARMSEEIDGLRAELIASNQARLETEAHLESMADRMVELEGEVREECYLEFESRLESELSRWKAQWQAEQDRNDEHMDRKLEIYTRSIDAADTEPQSLSNSNQGLREVGDGGEPEEDKENAHSGPGKIDNLQIENERLRREVETLRRELAVKSPSKSQGQNRRMPLRESRVGRDRSNTPDTEGDGMGMEEQFERLSVNGSGRERSPTKKVKKLVARKWDLLDEGEML